MMSSLLSWCFPDKTITYVCTKKVLNFQILQNKWALLWVVRSCTVAAFSWNYTTNRTCIFRNQHISLLLTALSSLHLQFLCSNKAFQWLHTPQHQRNSCRELYFVKISNVFLLLHFSATLARHFDKAGATWEVRWILSCFYWDNFFSTSGTVWGLEWEWGWLHTDVLVLLSCLS